MRFAKNTSISVSLFTLASCFGFMANLAYAQDVNTDKPILPSGLQPSSSAPVLPTGLRSSSDAEPALPIMLGSSSSETGGSLKKSFELPFDFSGFWEMRGGLRTRNDRYQKDTSIGESRLQLQFDLDSENVAFKLVGDLLYDHVLNRHSINLETGEGWFDLRQASILLRPLPFADLKIGRQINTWGTGDMLFINDLFPKDWNSYFSGRDDEYLKAPSDVAKLSLFSDLVNVDIVYAPRFDSDRYIDGRRISYWNANAGRRAGRDAVVRTDKPDKVFHDDEWALRFFRTINSYELALYFYDGYWKSPAGNDPDTGLATFPRLQVLGCSSRGPLGRGILSLESGWYRSADDFHGKNPMIRNSEMRYLIGYEQELARDLTGGLQYYVEQMLDFDEYKATLPPGMRAADEYRQVLTVRLTKLLMSQNLMLGMFCYYSPTDHDAYLRPKVSYKIDDHWIVECGGNFFIGAQNHTFFGQFELNNNIYASLRYGF